MQPAKASLLDSIPEKGLFSVVLKTRRTSTFCTPSWLMFEYRGRRFSLNVSLKPIRRTNSFDRFCSVHLWRRGRARRSLPPGYERISMPGLIRRQAEENGFPLERTP